MYLIIIVNLHLNTYIENTYIYHARMYVRVRLALECIRSTNYEKLN